MDAAKITLLQGELDMIVDAEWILTKNRILEKIAQTLGALQQQQAALLDKYAGLLPAAVIETAPKISRGENYRGLPWLVLDYPRVFGKYDQFAIRSMFWWGRFFSVTLQLSGYYKEKMEPSLIRHFPAARAAGFNICIHESRWEHHFEPGNYRALAELTESGFQELVHGKPFLKLAVKYPVENWNDAPELLFGSFRSLVEWMAGDQLPSR